MIEQFWTCLYSCSVEHKVCLLQFTTRTSRVPTKLQDLQGSDGPHLLTIEKSGDHGAIRASITSTWCCTRIMRAWSANWASQSTVFCLHISLWVVLAHKGLCREIEGFGQELSISTGSEEFVSCRLAYILLLTFVFTGETDS